MSRTFRQNPTNHYFRHPKTKKEITENAGLEVDEYCEGEYRISKRNRRHRFIPDAYDDLSYSE
jgi:hypothetical protein